MKEYQAES